MNFDTIHYNEPLTGPHFKCETRRRFLINFPVDPEILQDYIPPTSSLKIREDYAWVTACCVSLKKMRPWFLPKFLGISFNYLVLRTRAIMEFPDGKEREVVIVLQTNVSRKISTWVGNLLFNMDFRQRDINLEEYDDHWKVEMKDKGRIQFQAEIPKNSFSYEIQPGSAFNSTEELREYFINVSYGSKWKDGKVYTFPESREQWDIKTTKVEITNDSLITDLLDIKPQPDHSITVAGYQHYYHWKSMSWTV